MKKIIFYTFFFIIPSLLAIYLIYRLAVTDGLIKSDYIIMLIIFILALFRRVVQPRMLDS